MKISTFQPKLKRRREGKTNYKKRLALLKSKLPRIVARKSNKHILAQLVEFNPKGDRTIASAHSKELSSFGWIGKANIPSAYLVGLLLGKRGVEKGVKEAILDLGIQTPVHGSKCFAVLKGAVDMGLNVRHGENALPEEGRAEGKHIEEFAGKLGEENVKRRFSQYIKEKVSLTNLAESFQNAKRKIKKKEEKQAEEREPQKTKKNG